MKKAVKWITGIAILSAAVLLVVLKLVDESNPTRLRLRMRRREAI